MPESRISMTVREPKEGVRVIDIAGELTSYGEPVLTEAYQDADRPGVKTVLLNFEKLDYMNSGGIGLLVTTLIRAQRKGQSLGTFGLTDHYREIFSLTRLDEAIGVYHNEAEALATT